MLHPLAMENLPKAEFVPQAVIGQPIASIGEAARLPLVKGHDDLDDFEGLALLLDDSVPFTILHYRGHPPRTSTVYLPISLGDGRRIGEVIARILRELKLDQANLIWQRADDPSL
jgi:hypothetical protein